MQARIEELTKQLHQQNLQTTQTTLLPGPTPPQNVVSQIIPDNPADNDPATKKK
jgi:hypothetical protein